MNKQEFLAALRKGLAGLPQEDIERSIEFYSEMIDDRIEEGMAEEEAAAAVGPIKDIISQILTEISLPKLVKAKVKPDRKLQVWEIVLLVLGSPVWLPLLFAAIFILLAVYIVIWSAILVLYAVDLAVAAGGVAGILATFTYMLSGNAAGAVLFLGAGLICGGLAILLFFCFNQIAKGILLLSRKMLLGIKSCFIRKGDEQ